MTSHSSSTSMRTSFCGLLLALSLSLAEAQFPTLPSDLTIVESQVDPKVTISFKETEVCERTAGSNSYSGFVHLPGSGLSDVGGYNINTYFIYFEARQNASSAPLAIYLAGGPGEASIYAALSSENGPCYVNINGTDTVDASWSFNEYANVLYIDQPVQTGFSYGELVNATYNLANLSLITPTEITESSLPTVNATFGYGTFSNQDFNTTANNTVFAGKALWHFAEHWLSSFPNYTTSSNKLSLWGNSYGGYWVPEAAVQISDKLDSLPAEHPLVSKNITIDAIGLTNACVDIESGIAGYPEYAYNNTYGVQFVSESLYEESLNNLTKSGGCLELIQQCRALGELSDPDATGSNATVNELCMGAFAFCQFYIIQSFPELNNRSAFDIAIPAESPCPFYLPVTWYLNNATTQAALGVANNYSDIANSVASNFGIPGPYTNRLPSESTGDLVRQNGLPHVEHLLSKGVKVAFIFGDRDYRCPWTGGEATALAAKWSHQADFAAAGYEELQGVQTPIEQGGLKALVKQYGQFSFSRVMDAGHSVSAYAPETVYRIFERTLMGLDVVTGTQSVDNGYHTQGPKDSYGWRNQLPESVPSTCMVAGQFQDANPWAIVTGRSS